MKWKQIACLIFLFLLGWLLFCFKGSYPSSDKKVVTDTVLVTKIDSFVVHDTVYVTKPKKTSEIVLDTVFLESKSGEVIDIPITQRFYSGDKYKAWVSGYNPSLDSLMIFSKETTKNIVQTRNIYLNKTEYYFNVGSNFIDGRISPYIGASVKFKRGLALGADFGYINKSVYYGVNVGFKINK